MIFQPEVSLSSLVSYTLRKQEKWSGFLLFLDRGGWSVMEKQSSGVVLVVVEASIGAHRVVGFLARRF